MTKSLPGNLFQHLSFIYANFWNTSDGGNNKKLVPNKNWFYEKIDELT